MFGPDEMGVRAHPLFWLGFKLGPDDPRGWDWFTPAAARQRWARWAAGRPGLAGSLGCQAHGRAVCRAIIYVEGLVTRLIAGYACYTCYRRPPSHPHDRMPH